ncbi:hypothetical protein ADUPG1_006933, partial [Aduncisulcus paluster]
MDMKPNFPALCKTIPPFIMPETTEPYSSVRHPSFSLPSRQKQILSSDIPVNPRLITLSTPKTKEQRPQQPRKKVLPEKKPYRRTQKVIAVNSLSDDTLLNNTSIFSSAKTFSQHSNPIPSSLGKSIHTRLKSPLMSPIPHPPSTSSILDRAKSSRTSFSKNSNPFSASQSSSAPRYRRPSELRPHTHSGQVSSTELSEARLNKESQMISISEHEVSDLVSSAIPFEDLSPYMNIEMVKREIIEGHKILSRDSDHQTPSFSPVPESSSLSSILASYLSLFSSSSGSFLDGMLQSALKPLTPPHSHVVTSTLSSLLPLALCVVMTSPIPPKQCYRYIVTKNRSVWTTVVFPPLHPSSEVDSLILEAWLKYINDRYILKIDTALQRIVQREYETKSFSMTRHFDERYSLTRDEDLSHPSTLSTLISLSFRILCESGRILNMFTANSPALSVVSVAVSLFLPLFSSLTTSSHQHLTHLTTLHSAELSSVLEKLHTCESELKKITADKNSIWKMYERLQRDHVELKDTHSLVRQECDSLKQRYNLTLRELSTIAVGEDMFVEKKLRKESLGVRCVRGLENEIGIRVTDGRKKKRKVDASNEKEDIDFSSKILVDTFNSKENISYQVMDKSKFLEFVSRVLGEEIYLKDQVEEEKEKERKLMERRLRVEWELDDEYEEEEEEEEGKMQSHIIPAGGSPNQSSGQWHDVPASLVSTDPHS